MDNFQNFHNLHNLQLKEDFFSELPNPIENQLIKGYNKVNDILKNLSNYNDMIAKLEEYSKANINCYKVVISGLLYGILYDHKRSNELFQYLFVINKDNFDFLLLTLNSLIEQSHLKMSPGNYYQIFITFDKLVHMNNSKLIDLIVVLLRVVFVGRWLNERLEFYKCFLGFLNNKMNWIISNTNQYLAGLIFIKILRLTTENHFLALDKINPHVETYKEILKEELGILSKLWSNKRENILSIGKELVRNLICLSKANLPEINLMIEDIAKSHDNIANVPSYIKLLESPQHFQGFNPYVHIQIPPLLEKMLVFIMTEVKRANYARYVNWMVKKFQIVGDAEFSLFVDITRFIITCWSCLTPSKQMKHEYTPRWIMLGYILKLNRNEILAAEIKQAIYYDWLFFKKEKDPFALIEPGLAIIFNSIKDFPHLTTELIAFISSYAENFDQAYKKNIQNCVTEAFRQAEVYQMFILKRVFSEENLNEDIKHIFEVLIKYNREEENLTNLTNITNITNIQNVATSNLEDDSMISNDSDYSILTNTNSPSSPSNADLSSLNLNELIQQQTKVKNKRIVETEIFIHPSLDELVDPITMKNFLNYKNRNSFKNLLDEMTKRFVDKIKQNNMFNSKLIALNPINAIIYSSFANFYLNIFKEELITDIIMDNKSSEENSSASNNTNSSFNNSIISNKSKNTINVSLLIIDYLISKSSFEKNDKEFNFILELIKMILQKYPNFIVRLIYQFSLKNSLSSQSKIITHKNLFSIFSKIFEDNVALIKEKLLQFFSTCVDFLDMELINYFLTNGLIIFSHIFNDDSDLIFSIIEFADNESLNKITNDITSNKYSLIEKSANLYKLITSSLSLNINDEGKLWNIILSHNNITKITNLKEFLRNMVTNAKLIARKHKSSMKFSSEFFKNIMKCIKTVFLNELNESKLNECFHLFDFPYLYSDYVYSIFSYLQVKFSTGVNKSFPFIFSSLVDEYLRQVESYEDKIYFMENFLKLIKEFVKIEKNHNRSVLFDNKFNVQNLKNKLDHLLRTFKFEFEEV